MRRRVFVLTAAILFVLSWMFPVGAGLVSNPTSLPHWWGTVDVALAFAVAVAALCIPGLAHENMDKQAKQSRSRIGSIGVRCTRY
jgi:protein-S-isoprenylcysteine O-methyltransferase Ste14